MTLAIDADSTLEDVCFEVCTALDRSAITAVLTGGSAATIYAPHAYQSRDADFIITMYASGGALVLARLGYGLNGQTYEHTASPYTLDFPPGPLAIGNDLVTEWTTLRRNNRLLNILSRTDCVRDRLMSFYAYADRSALSAAVGVAQSGVVDAARIRRWSAREGYAKQCEEFFGHLER